MKSAATYTHHCSISTSIRSEGIVNRTGSWITIFLILSLYTVTCKASILTFDQIRIGGVVSPTSSGNNLEDDYGDRITGSPMNVPGGQFTYGNGGEGSTPNVVIEFFAGNGTNLSLWTNEYGDLNNVAFGNNDSGASLNFQLTADPGFVVDL
ncbi:MAG: hypothetical protein B6D78_13235 [gamma proteobacterium symbiont of Ctena orbiculata]|nr:MAG: hypothetical protein B6D78_13235 [gamma proteobacterium symbiont of Ctena orbiculata]PVV25790.1 MAG: hypothetical protein B6D79_08310 [gamma proteobacterium symbiont of Ctena orbiculata]